MKRRAFLRFLGLTPVVGPTVVKAMAVAPAAVLTSDTFTLAKLERAIELASRVSTRPYIMLLPAQDHLAWQWFAADIDVVTVEPLPEEMPS